MIQPLPEDRRTNVWRCFGACAISSATICAASRQSAESNVARIAPGSSRADGEQATELPECGNCR
jgi:hypothetical protein